MSKKLNDEENYELVLLASNVKYYRDKFAITQEKLAEYSELSTRTISDIETASTNPTYITFKSLAKGFSKFGVTMDDLACDILREGMPYHLPRKKNEDYGRTVKNSRK